MIQRGSTYIGLRGLLIDFIAVSYDLLSDNSYV